MNIWHAVLMGLVQGVGEFLPISSSAHLVLMPWLFRFPDPGLTFDIGLHLGTLIAVAAYFWRDWLNLFLGAVRRGPSNEKRLFWFLALATLPGAAFGFLFEEQAETVFRTPELIAVMLMVMGVILWLADRRGVKKMDINRIGLGHSLLIGLSQALAIIPGVSRSGATISAGLLVGLSREGAARFSFLLSAPIILGAGLVNLPELIQHPEQINLIFMTGILVSAVAGIVSIGFLLRFIRTQSYLPFVWYRCLLGAAVIAVALSRG